MGQQRTFADTLFVTRHRTTRRAQLLTGMGQTIPWRTLEGMVAPHYPTTGRGGPPAAGDDAPHPFPPEAVLSPKVVCTSFGGHLYRASLAGEWAIWQSHDPTHLLGPIWRCVRQPQPFSHGGLARQAVVVVANFRPGGLPYP
jgi:hypothetical protein